MIFRLAHLSTFCFAIAKLFEVEPVAQWSWWTVFAPSLVCFGIGTAIIMAALVYVSRGS